jgi:hypothetical protein
MTDPVVTWDSVSKDVVADVAAWMLDECVAAKSRWNIITTSDNLVSRGMQKLFNEAEVTITSTVLLKAMQDLASVPAKAVVPEPAPYVAPPYVPYVAPLPASGPLVEPYPAPPTVPPAVP